ncbi:MAG: tRNA pseudouridine synthase A, partial [Gammaproteobacteria bacterium]|nr:tRNA pseudouridine synthase A [Gammaproteobacteria bacterium]
VSADFDARRSAQSRRYRYILCAQPIRPVLYRSRVGWTYKSLAVEPMQQAATALLGEHDFSSFRAAGCQAKHPVRRIHSLSVSAAAPFVHIDIEANAFIHHMVRNIVGTLIPIGAGERSAEWMEEVLAARDRTKAGITAAAAGLYLIGARYPASDELPDLPPPPSFAC